MNYYISTNGRMTIFCTIDSVYAFKSHGWTVTKLDNNFAQFLSKIYGIRPNDVFVSIQIA